MSIVWVVKRYRHTGSQGIVRLPGVRITVRIGKQIKQLGDTLLEGRNETMAEQLAEERNWDALCEKAEKLRGKNYPGQKLQTVWA